MEFEKSLEELKKMAEKIGSEDVTLEESINCFEKGMKKYEECQKILTSAKQKIEIAGKEGETL